MSVDGQKSSSDDFLEADVQVDGLVGSLSTANGYELGTNDYREDGFGLKLTTPNGEVSRQASYLRSLLDEDFEVSFPLAEAINIRESLESRNVLENGDLNPDIPGYLVWAAENADNILSDDPENLYGDGSSYSFSPEEKWTALILDSRCRKFESDSSRDNRYVKGKNLEENIPLNPKQFGQFMSHVEEMTEGDIRFGRSSTTTWNVDRTYQEGVLEEIHEDFDPVEELE